MLGEARKGLKEKGRARRRYWACQWKEHQMLSVVWQHKRAAG